jgi:UDP-N-acetylmuramoyl-tripeptide--D-alanyl-D-alanine ligase
LLGIDDKTEVAVFEIGVYYYPGDIINSCKYFCPTVGIITNIGVDHLNRCGTIENYIKAKAELLEGMSHKGTLILNADDENIKKIDLTPFKGRIIYFGKNAKAEFMAISISYGKDGMNFILRHNNKDYYAFVPGYGEQNVYNALAAIAGAYVKGISIEESLRRLKYFNHIKSHLQIFEGIHGCTVIDDTWSSNSLSVEKALDVLKTLGINKNKITVLGHITLLGEATQSEHEKVGKLVVEKGADFLIVRGDIAKIIGETAISFGMNRNNIFFCKDSTEVIEVIKRLANENSLILVKTDWYDSSTDLLKEIIVKKE